MKILNHLLVILLLFLLFLQACNSPSQDARKANHEAGATWSIEKAREWQENQPWLRGANYIPSNAINQLETWQAETFSPEVIDRELGWAEETGFNCMRVYLHHLAWLVDKNGFKSRLDQYLSIAGSHGMKTIFVFFDDCWNAEYQAGKQPAPKPGIHNSGWVRDPGDLLFRDSTLTATLEAYVKDILSSFSEDDRIILWDLYNEPGNSNLGNRSMPLLKNVFAWAREINPSQPLTSGVWNIALGELNLFQVSNSDIITYHDYNNEYIHSRTIDSLQLYNRPLVCTEYMARTRNSRFENIMPLLKKNNIGAFNWGLVAGKSNTIYAWDTPLPDGSEPVTWFCDIFRADGTPYDSEEIDFIKKMTMSNP